MEGVYVIGMYKNIWKFISCLVSVGIIFSICWDIIIFLIGNVFFFVFVDKVVNIFCNGYFYILFGGIVYFYFKNGYWDVWIIGIVWDEGIVVYDFDCGRKNVVFKVDDVEGVGGFKGGFVEMG